MMHRFATALTTSESALLDAMRAVAALLVMFSHARALFFVDYAEAHDAGIVTKAFYFLTGLGHQSVMIFFVLSGFLIGGAVLGKIRARAWNWSGYSINRLTRLYLVLIPALVLGFGWDELGLSLYGSDGVYGGLAATDNIIVGPVGDRLTWQALWSNAFFLQGITAPTFGSNGPLWSLNYEFWYYVIFPMVTVTWMLKRNAGARLVVVAIALAMLTTFLRGGIAWYFLMWLSGVAVALMKKPAAPQHIQSRFCGIAGVLALLALLALLRAGRVQVSFGSDLGIAIAFAFVLYGLLNETASSSGAVLGAAIGLFRRVAAFSYSLYLVHLPFLIFLRAAVLGDERWRLSWTTFAPWLFICATTIGYSYLVYLMTERHTTVVRNWLAGRAHYLRPKLAKLQ